MKNYKVKLEFIYSDVVHVQAEDGKEAINKAIAESNEEFEYLYDSKIEEEE